MCRTFLSVLIGLIQLPTFIIFSQGEYSGRGGAVRGVADAMGLSLSERGEMGKDREAWRATVHGVEKSWT